MLYRKAALLQGWISLVLYNKAALRQGYDIPGFLRGVGWFWCDGCARGACARCARADARRGEVQPAKWSGVPLSRPPSHTHKQPSCRIRGVKTNFTLQKKIGTESTFSGRG